MRRLFLTFLATAALATAAQAQTATPGSYAVPAGSSTNVTLSGMAGVQFALIGSTTNAGFRTRVSTCLRLKA